MGMGDNTLRHSHPSPPPHTPSATTPLPSPFPQKFTNFEHGTRVPLIIRAPWLSGSAGVTTDAIAELVDVFPTIADLAGVQAPAEYGLDGASLRGVMGSSTAAAEGAAPTQILPPPSPHVGTYAFSVYPRCPPASVTNASLFWQDNDCLMTERSAFRFMGYTVRVDRYRYTEWRAWDGGNLTADWSEAGLVGAELYDHTGDDGGSFDGPWEVVNVAGQAGYAGVQRDLEGVLRGVAGG
jgi:iduronate 2-sulfatase